MTVKKPAAGDIAEYKPRGADDGVRCEILGHTAKRVRIWLRLAGGALAVRYVKGERLRRIGGGLLESGGGGMRASERSTTELSGASYALRCCIYMQNAVEVRL